MEQCKNMFEKIYAWENLLDAYHHAASEKWFRDDVAAFSAHLGENLTDIQNSLIWKTYTVGRYREFYVYEPKKRLVMALNFRDRVVQWAIYLQLNPLLDNQFIYHSYGCRVGKGTTRAADQLQYWMRMADRKPIPWYYLKLDISKYFYRVDHNVLLGILRRKFKGEDDLLWLMDKIINCDHTPFGLPPGLNVDDIPPSERLFEVGMPIGNLTSQLLANVCLNELDQYIKHELRVHCYVRYMDDMVLLHPDKTFLNKCKDLIEEYLNDILHLELNSKTTIGKVSCGITFVGYVIRPTYRKLKRKSLRKMKARIRYIQKEYESGLIDFEDVNNTMQSTSDRCQTLTAMDSGSGSLKTSPSSAERHAGKEVSHDRHQHPDRSHRRRFIYRNILLRPPGWSKARWEKRRSAGDRHQLHQGKRAAH